MALCLFSVRRELAGECCKHLRLCVLHDNEVLRYYTIPRGLLLLFFKGIISKTFWMQSKSNRWQILGGAKPQDNYIKMDFIQTKTSNFLGNNWEIISSQTIQGLFKKKYGKEAGSEWETTATTYLYVKNIVSDKIFTYQVWLGGVIF